MIFCLKLFDNCFFFGSYQYLLFLICSNCIHPSTVHIQATSSLRDTWEISAHITKWVWHRDGPHSHIHSAHIQQWITVQTWQPELGAHDICMPGFWSRIGSAVVRQLATRSRPPVEHNSLLNVSRGLACQRAWPKIAIWVVTPGLQLKIIFTIDSWADYFQPRA